jgi:hypothetical protein
MPKYLDQQGKHHGEQAREAMRLLGAHTPKLIAAVWDLDNTNPEHIKLGFLPGSHVKDCAGAVFELAMMSSQKVSASLNGMKITVDELPWQKKARAQKLAIKAAGQDESRAVA